MPASLRSDFIHIVGITIHIAGIGMVCIVTKVKALRAAGLLANHGPTRVRLLMISSDIGSASLTTTLDSSSVATLGESLFQPAAARLRRIAD